VSFDDEVRRKGVRRKKGTQTDWPGTGKAADDPDGSFVEELERNEEIG